MMLPLLLEIYMAYYNYCVFFKRIATYKGWTINGIFDYVVRKLIALGDATGTNYITANIIVYILPLTIILICGYIGWVIYTVNRKPSEAIK